MKRTFSGKVADKKLTVYDEADMKSWIASLDGMPVSVTIEKETHKRSNQQNRFLWGIVYKTISDFTGYDEDEVHALCKEKFNPKFLNIVNVNTGEETEERIAGSTAKLSTKDFIEYVEKIQRYFAGLGCVIPDPNQQNFLEE